MAEFVFISKNTLSVPLKIKLGEPFFLLLNPAAPPMESDFQQNQSNILKPKMKGPPKKTARRSLHTSLHSICDNRPAPPKEC